EIRRGVVILVQAEIISVETKVDVEAAVAIVVSQSGVGECTERRLGERKRARLVFELSVALIDEEKRAGIAYGEKILQATIFEIRRGVVILVQAEIISVETKVDVEAAVAIVVSQSGVGECTERRLGERKRARLVFELSVALIDEEKRAGIAYGEKILQATIFE